MYTFEQLQAFENIGKVARLAKPLRNEGWKQDLGPMMFNKTFVPMVNFHVPDDIPPDDLGSPAARTWGNTYFGIL